MRFKQVLSAMRRMPLCAYLFANLDFRILNGLISLISISQDGRLTTTDSSNPSSPVAILF
jgi:hypothetical protein